MGFDCRDKGLEGITGDLAGNYVTALVLDPEVFGTPASMRQMYTPGKPYVTAKAGCPAAGVAVETAEWRKRQTGRASLERWCGRKVVKCCCICP